MRLTTRFHLMSKLQMGGSITSLLLHVLMVFKGTTLLFPLKGQGLREMRQQESATFLHIHFRNTRSFDFAILGLQFREGFFISYTELVSLLHSCYRSGLRHYELIQFVTAFIHEQKFRPRFHCNILNNSLINKFRYKHFTFVKNLLSAYLHTQYKIPICGDGDIYVTVTLLHPHS